ncbi:MAG: UDP-N-acetylglucosamine 1-carboxyvinyltransferase [Deltaproteobacteria bacterium]|nr:UDP-N-acetylglucosamine 1-carboxyvinyltransferase [Deltaproteobacteria bacterium]
MDGMRIRGGRPLSGSVQVSGAKNAALPILCATLLTEGECLLGNVPALHDIDTTAELLRILGRAVDCRPPRVRVGPSTAALVEAPYDLVKKMRASVLVLGPLLARFGRARVSLPGGCQIGARPVDQHLKGLETLGARISLDKGYILAEAERLRGAEVVFDMPTVTGTENLMMAAALAHGQSALINCAREPEVVELARVLNKMGARVSGAGTAVVQVEGVRELGPFDHSIISDRIEAGTYMVAAAATGGEVRIERVPVEHLEAFISKLRAAGVAVEPDGAAACVSRSGQVRSVDVTTAPYPGFPTDMQAQFMVLMCLAGGTARMSETVFENRFMHVPELGRMGAAIEVSGHSAYVRGVGRLQGADVMATDLRASASLVIAGLVAAQGETLVRRVYHLDRGYEHMEQKLRALGADIERVAGLKA